MKSYVTLAQNICPICGKQFDTGELLLDKRLQNTFETHTVTGFGLCPEDQQKFDEGYLAIVEIDPKKSEASPGGKIKAEDAYRTGRVAHMRRTVVKEVFNTNIPENLPLIYIDPEGMEKLIKMTEE